MDLSEMCNSQHIVIVPLGHGVVDLEVFSEGRSHIALYQANDYTDGCIQIFPANLPHQIRCSPQVKQVEFIHCYLEPTFLAQIAHESIDPDRVELLLELKKIDRLIQQIGIALKADLEVSRTGDGFYADSMATALSAHLLRHYSTRKHKLREHEDGLSKYKLVQAIEYINDHLSESISLASIAAELKMSQYYFCRLFKQSTGMTPHQYLIHSG
jgi:AraC family transcriptional regulator